jgi:biotin carboxyl carrier protein
VRIEQLYPFPAPEYQAVLARYPNARESSGARKSRRTRAPGIRSAIACRNARRRAELLYAGRAPASAPATGLAKIHEANSAKLVQTALTAAKKTGEPRLSGRAGAAAWPRCPRGSEFMTVEIRVPQLPESVADATLVAWRKQPGEAVSRDENLADLETDKVVLEVPAPVAGVLQEIRVRRAPASRAANCWRSSMKRRQRPRRLRAARADDAPARSASPSGWCRRKRRRRS